MSTAQVVMENLNTFQVFEDYADNHDECPALPWRTLVLEIADLFDISVVLAADIANDLVDKGYFRRVGWDEYVELTPDGLKEWI